MPRDHYVSQVHLKHFCLPERPGYLNTFRKSNSVNFLAPTDSVCQIENGSANSYLLQSRIIEDVLREIEPKYNSAIESCLGGNLAADDVFVISGFIAYIHTCSPTAMRVASIPIRGSLQMTAELLDSQGLFPQPPPSLEGKSLSDLLRAGCLSFNIDPRYPQAIGVTNVINIASTLANCPWDILLNENEDAKFFSSDFPIFIVPERPGQPALKIVPLTPNLAIRLYPERRTGTPSFQFRRHRSRTIQVSRQEAVEINRWIVRAAEDLVFSPRSYDWAARFVERNRAFRTDGRNFRLPSRDGAAQLSTLGVFPTQSA